MRLFLIIQYQFFIISLALVTFITFLHVFINNYKEHLKWKYESGILRRWFFTFPRTRWKGSLPLGKLEVLNRYPSSHSTMKKKENFAFLD